MGRIPCCEKDNVKRGQWTPEEDNKLSSYIAQQGTRNWHLIPKSAGIFLGIHLIVMIFLIFFMSFLYTRTKLRSSKMGEELPVALD